MYLLQYLMNRGRISRKSRILFVNDGSRDGTWEIIERLHIGNHLFSGLNLSRNRGHQNALLAGLMYAKDRADMAISMDADLQDDITVCAPAGSGTPSLSAPPLKPSTVL